MAIISGNLTIDLIFLSIHLDELDQLDKYFLKTKL